MTEAEILLERRWAARDERYADPALGRREPLSEDEVDQVRAWRFDEAVEIESQAMKLAALAWEAPRRIAS